MICTNKSDEENMDAIKIYICTLFKCKKEMENIKSI